MGKRIAYEKIFTPQGLLGDVSKNPNLDFLMNIFKIPRIYGVSGFGEWNVGQHTVATAFLALYWSAFKRYTQEKRDRLVTLALVHDAHEAVIGDILPFFKTRQIRTAIDKIQKDILESFSIAEEPNLKAELKLIDMVSFLYEIGQSKLSGLDLSKRKLLQRIYSRQKEAIFDYSRQIGITKREVVAFLNRIGLQRY